jgi:integrase
VIVVPAGLCGRLVLGVDTTVIALWMGHENVATTQVYINAELALKERAIARTALRSRTSIRLTTSRSIRTPSIRSAAR